MRAEDARVPSCRCLAGRARERCRVGVAACFLGDPYGDVVILYTAELEALMLPQMARRILKAEARRLGVPLDPAEVVLRRVQGGSSNAPRARCMPMRS